MSSTFSSAIGELTVSSTSEECSTLAKTIYTVQKEILSTSETPTKQTFSIYTNASESVGEIDVYIFENSYAAYIHWISIEPEYQQKGIATQGIQYTLGYLQDLEYINCVYALPVSEISSSVFTNNGFEKSSQLSSTMESWYQKRL